MIPDNFNKIMERKQFVEDLQGYTRAFTFVTVKDGKLFIGHRIERTIGKLTQIEYQDLDSFIKYFDRI